MTKQNHPRAFRDLLARDEILVMPGVYDGLSALAARRAGFEACSISGAAVAASRLGYPDLGLMTYNEILEQSRAIVRVADLPIIADVDTGFGGPLNVIRTIRAFEDIGVAGVHIEDQVFPKKCGHFARKEVIPTDEMVAKVRAVRHAVQNPDFVLVARTDARQPEGLDAAIERSHRYVEAGADVVFLEAPKTREELERIGREDFGVPLWANLAEGGRTPLLDPPELQELGFKVAVYPGAASKTAARVLVDLMAGIREHGSVRPFLDGMMTLDERSELLGLADYEALDDELSGRAPEGAAQ